MLRILQIALSASTLLLTACTTTDSVVFVTKTSLGIDADASAPGVSIAYDRVEGYLAPRYRNAKAPTVYADFGTNGNVFADRKIKQVYATGKAASKVSSPNSGSVAGSSGSAGSAGAGGSSDAGATGTGSGNGNASIVTITPQVTQDNVAGTGKTMFFGTSTVLGFKIGYSTSAIESLTLGYKRKEYSHIPGGNTPEDYPSTLAAFDNHTATLDKNNTGLSVRQFFATGEAADNLADETTIRSGLRVQAANALASYEEEERHQTRYVLNSLVCLSRLDDAKLPTVWDHAEALQLFEDANVLKNIRAATPHDSRAIYTDNLRQYKAVSPLHTVLLQGHAERVCKLARGG